MRGRYRSNCPQSARRIHEPLLHHCEQTPSPPLLRMLTNPQCPVCQSSISFISGLKMWNPWRVTCPHCHAKLMMSKLVKVFSVLCIPLGIVYGSIPIYMEETGRWATHNSLVFFAITAPALLVIAYGQWLRTRLYARDGATR